MPTVGDLCKHFDDNANLLSFECRTCDDLCEAIRALNELKVLTLLTLKDADPNCLDSKGRHALYSLHPPEDIADDIHFSKRVVIAQLLAAFGAEIPTSEALWITQISDCAKKYGPECSLEISVFLRITNYGFSSLAAYFKVTTAGRCALS